MNVFIYDDYLSEKKYFKTISKIETRITDLGLNGKIVRLNLLNNVSSHIDSEIKRGAKTLIAVGDNQTLNKVVNSICLSDFPEAKNIPVFIIPVFKEKNEIAHNLGIKDYLSACEILSSRRITEINTVKINNSFFISEASIETEGTKIEIDKDYSIEIMEKGRIVVNNLSLDKKDLPDNLTNISPSDGKIELFVKSKKEKNTKSVFYFDKIIIENKKRPVLIDRAIEIKTPASVTIGEKNIKLIVGKDRIF